ncbi:Gfo/Idh/MocA family oxidoreductase [Eubacteriales bacterium OttesenSCG-928-N13]|nr:Gfo/Idh/MocA family oxidoreductase [Eubacteriales bacterium OttesenSCG-928-N13]
MLQIGIIGCGMITQMRHAPEYLENKYAQVVGWYDAMPERAQDMATKYGGQVFDDWKQMIDQGKLDAVSVCAPNAAHAEITIYALEHGLHVMCEKPMATTLEDCKRMVDAAKAAGKHLFIGQNQRFNKAHIKAHDLIRQGVIGKVLTFRSSFGHAGPEIWTKSAKTWFYHKSMAAFGAVFDLGIHKIDLMQYLLGEDFVQVAAMLGTLDKTFEDGSPISVDDNACITLASKSGAIGQINASWTYYGGEDNSTRIYGSKGVMHIFEDDEHPLFITNEDSRTNYEGLGEMQTNDNQTNTGIIDAFVDDIRLDRPTSVSGESVYHAMRAVFGAVESAETGRFVQLNQEA